MRKSKEYKITFKKGKRSTGLSRIGEGTPQVEMKYRGRYLGYLAFNDSWNSNRDLGIQVKFRKKSSAEKCGLVWAILRAKFNDESEARSEVQRLKNEMLKVAYFDEEDAENS